MTAAENQRNLRQVIHSGLAFGIGMGLFLYWMTGSPYYGLVYDAKPNIIFANHLLRQSV